VFVCVLKPGVKLSNERTAIPLRLVQRTQNRIGASAWANDPTSNMLLDDLRLYNRELTAADAAAIYAARNV
jgi:hypothetical protein